MHDSQRNGGFRLEQPLLLAAKAGDKIAYGRLVKLYQSPLRGFMRRLTNGDEALADDLAQETFIKAFNEVGSFRGDSAFKTWLMSIGYRLFLNHVQKHKRRAELLEGIPEERAETPHMNERRIDLERAMACLSADERTTVTLNAQEGMSHQEIADSLNMPLGTVKSHINRGRTKLKDILSA